MANYYEAFFRSNENAHAKVVSRTKSGNRIVLGEEISGLAAEVTVKTETAFTMDGTVIVASESRNLA